MEENYQSNDLKRDLDEIKVSLDELKGISILKGTNFITSSNLSEKQYLRNKSDSNFVISSKRFENI